MPNIYYRDDSSFVRRISQNNGPGPKVPHPFYYNSACIGSNNIPGLTIAASAAASSPGMPSANLRLRIYQKMRSKAYESMQLGADYGERAKTLQMVGTMLHAVRSPLKTMGDYMAKAARRKKKHIAPLMLKDSAEALLAFQYGVRPLIGSINSACNVAAMPYPRMHVEGICAEPFETLYTSGGRPTNESYYKSWTHGMVYQRAGFDVEIVHPTIFLAEQLGLLNPAAIAWELVPFSFVLDWFIPVGTWINNISDYAGCERSNAYVTTFSKTMGVVEYPNQGLRCTDKSILCKRELGLLDLPPFAEIELNLKQSKTHVLNALALIAALGINPKR